MVNYMFPKMPNVSEAHLNTEPQAPVRGGGGGTHIHIHECINYVLIVMCMVQVRMVGGWLCSLLRYGYCAAANMMA